MNKPALKNFAISARLELLARVRDRAAFYGITEEKYRDKAIVPTKSFQRLDGVMLSSRETQQRNDLLSRIRGKGYEQVMEEAAYTWFNRFISLRYMEEHGYHITRVDSLDVGLGITIVLLIGKMTVMK